ncbi:MAG TPA: hypothetical protein VFT95_02260, partial [Micromonosporaceae bacterium]|nr:hypothetical protein [Micromonosporaceae bacterium]
CADDPSYQLCVKEAKDPGSVNKGVPGVWYAHVAGCGVVICVEISNEQQRDVKINIDWGWGGKEKMNIKNGGFGWAGVGYKSAPHSMRGEGDWQMCGAVRVGACYFGGERKSGGYWHGGGIIFGLGVSGHYEN